MGWQSGRWFDGFARRFQRIARRIPAQRHGFIVHPIRPILNQPLRAIYHPWRLLGSKNNRCWLTIRCSFSRLSSSSVLRKLDRSEYFRRRMQARRCWENSTGASISDAECRISVPKRSHDNPIRVAPRSLAPKLCWEPPKRILCGLGWF